MSTREQLIYHGRESDILNALVDNKNMPHSAREAIAAAQVACMAGAAQLAEADATIAELVAALTALVGLAAICTDNPPSWSEHVNAARAALARVKGQA